MNRKIKFRGYKKIEFDETTDEEGKSSIQGFTAIVCNSSPQFHIMQYTGLKDKNGKEIYEGDIIFHTWKDWEPHKARDIGLLGSVNFNNGSFVIEAEYLGELDCGELEVIGNIYENPELLDEMNDDSDDDSRE